MSVNLARFLNFTQFNGKNNLLPDFPNSLKTCEIGVSEVSLISYLSDCEKVFHASMLVTERGEANLRLNHQFSRKGKGSVHYVCTGGVVGESGGMVLNLF